MKLEIYQQIFRKKKYSNVKFHENPSSESRVVLCGRTGGQTDTHDESNSALLNFMNAPKNCSRLG
jgi:hypothetical protein